jgi:hypothetical protein
MLLANDKSKSEKFPPPHEDGGFEAKLDNLQGVPLSFIADNASLVSTDFEVKIEKSRVPRDSRNLMRSLMLDIARSGRLQMRRNAKEMTVSTEGI